MKSENEKDIMPILRQSRVCLAGRLNARPRLNHKDLPSSQWDPIEMTEEVYKKLQRTYYPSLLTSMNTIVGNEKQSVFCYEMNITGKSDNLVFLPKKDNKGHLYPCNIKSVRLWFFKFGIILFSIEIEEHTDSFSDLTLMHSKWKKWNEEYDAIHTEELDSLLKPLAQLTPNSLASEITFAGTKMRQYQVVESNVLNDDLLYEIGTFSTIGVVNDGNHTRSYKPSDDYYQKIIKENVLSAYSNWKALALNDSFTVMALDDYYSKSEFDEYDEKGCLSDTGYRYFDLLYMRCLFEEFYCFDRNNSYREFVDNNSKKIESEKIENEIAYMEQHYFFEDMSYDFLPPLMYRAMAKGLNLQRDREQLTQHVKQSLRDARHERDNRAVNFVQIFAAVSVIWTIREMLIAISKETWSGSMTAILFLIIAMIFTIVLLKWPQLFTKLLHNNKK